MFPLSHKNDFFEGAKVYQSGKLKGAVALDLCDLYGGGPALPGTITNQRLNITHSARSPHSPGPARGAKRRIKESILTGTYI